MFKKIIHAIRTAFDMKDDMLKFKRVGKHDLPIPQCESYFAAGMDLRSRAAAILIPPGGRELIPTGFAVQIPYGYFGLVCPRSGLALKHGLTVLNAPGVVDSDYRGEVGVILANTSDEPFIVGYGDRIAQLVIGEASNVGLVGIEVEDQLTETERGEAGFGSTGIA